MASSSSVSSVSRQPLAFKPRSPRRVLLTRLLRQMRQLQEYDDVDTLESTSAFWKLRLELLAERRRSG